MAGSNQKNLDIVIRGRNEAKGAMKDASRDADSLASTFMKIAAGGAAISMASKAGASAVMGWVATHERAAAMAEGDLEGVLNAQIKVNMAWSEFGGSVPLIGESVKRAMDAMFNVEAMRKAIANLEELEQAAKTLGETTQKQMRETALLRAKAGGATPEAVSALELSFRAEDQQKLLDEVNKQELEAIKKAGQAYDLLLDARAERKTKWSNKQVETAEMTYARESKLVDELFAKRKQLEKDIAQVQVADVEIQRQKEVEGDSRRAEEKIAAIKKESDLRFSIEQDALRAAGRTAEAEVAAIRRRYALEREEIAKTIKDRTEQGRLLFMADKAEKAALEKAVGAGGRESFASRDLGMQQSYRFLRSAQGQADPAWATKQIRLAQEQKDLLVQIAKNVGVHVEQVEVSV